jgi:hypothetical protein
MELQDVLEFKTPIIKFEKCAESGPGRFDCEVNMNHFYFLMIMWILLPVGCSGGRLEEEAASRREEYKTARVMFDLDLGRSVSWQLMNPHGQCERQN